MSIPYFPMQVFWEGTDNYIDFGTSFFSAYIPWQTNDNIAQVNLIPFKNKLWQLYFSSSTLFDTNSLRKQSFKYEYIVNLVFFVVLT